MSKTTIFPQGIVEITVPYSQKIYISNYGGGTAIISYRSIPGNVPQEWYESQRITNTAVILGTFNLDQEIRIEAGESVVQYEVGSDPGQEIIGAAPGSLELAQNAAFDGTDWTLIDSAAASRYSQDAGQHIFYNAISGTAGDTISWLELLHANFTEIVFNESGQDRNIRFETSLDANAFSIDGGTGVIAFSNANDLLSFDAAETVFNDSGADIDFRVESDTNANAFFVEGSSGNIGFRNSSLQGWTGSLTALQIGEQNSIFSPSAGAGNLYLGANIFSDGLWRYLADGKAGRFDMSSDGFAIQTAASGTAGNAISSFTSIAKLYDSGITFNDDGADIDFRVESDINTHAFFVEGSSGNIGIGVSNPSDFSSFGYNLVVGGGTGNSGLTIFSNDEGYGSIHFGDGTTGNDSYECQIYFKHGAADDFISFAIAAATKLIISNSITHFNSEGADIDFRVESDTVTNAIFMDGATGIVSLPACYSHDMNGETYRDLLINDSGELGYDSSTIRKKTNVQNMEDISWLYDLRPVNFEFKRRTPDGTYFDEGTGIKKYGLIAEELESVNSDFVFYEDGLAEGIHYREFTAVLIKALQDQNARIAYLENRLTEV